MVRMSMFRSRRHATARPPRRRDRGLHHLRCDSLESRRLLAITPGQLYGNVPATWVDADGDTVTVSVTGALADGAGFTVSLAGKATDNADANSIALTGLTAANGLQVVVTPNALSTQPGGAFATLYSAGYTNVVEITYKAAPPALQDTVAGRTQMLITAKGALDQETVLKLAKEAGLDMAQLKRDLNSAAIDEALKKNRDLAGQLEITGTPAFIIGKEFVPGAAELDTFKTIVARARKG